MRCYTNQQVNKIIHEIEELKGTMNKVPESTMKTKIGILLSDISIDLICYETVELTLGEIRFKGLK